MNQMVKKFLFTAGLLGLSLAPVVSYAEDAPAATAQPSAQHQETHSNSDFCVGFLSHANQEVGRLNNVKAPTTQAVPQTQDLQTVKGTSTAEGGELGVNISKFELAASTDAQKQALSNFRTAVRTAQQTRLAAYQKAMADFKTASDALVASNKSTGESAAKSYKEALASAVKQAVADCNAKVDPKTIAKSYKDALETAKKKLNTDLKTSSTGVTKGAAMQALVHSRNDALNKAQSDFRASIDAAVKALKAAFPNGTAVTKPMHSDNHTEVHQ